jgi:predicted peptidase
MIARGSDLGIVKDWALPKMLSETPASHANTSDERAKEMTSQPPTVPEILAETLGGDCPLLVLSPQCPKGTEWKHSSMYGLVTYLIEQVVKTFSVDPARVYLTGVSMGGLGNISSI